MTAPTKCCNQIDETTEDEMYEREMNQEERFLRNYCNQRKKGHCKFKQTPKWDSS